MGTWAGRAVALAAVVVVGSYVSGGSGPTTGPASGSALTVGGTAAPDRAAPADAPPPTAAEPVAGRALFVPAEGGDGDSWRDTTGREYRLGLINTPEVGECFAAEATAERKALVADGFSADVYTTDRYGRGVSVVGTADGRDLNVHLARYGFADDRYLAQFRSEHPQLAARLDTAFAAARAERRGLWGACRGGAAPAHAPAAGPAADPAAAPAVIAVAPPAPAAGASCHPDYATCTPVRGDGSGGGEPNDLDCGDVSGPVRLRQVGVDPYRFDADGDGTGCD